MTHHFISDADIIANLESGNHSVSDYFFYGNTIAFWSATGGLKLVVIEVESVNKATKEFLHGNGAPRYANRFELLKVGFKLRWPNLISGIAEGRWIDDVYSVRFFPQCATDDNVGQLIQDIRFAERLRVDASHGSISEKGLLALVGLPQLEELIVSGNPVSANAIATFRNALPKCLVIA